MDPLTHTLVGGTLARTGLGGRTRLATAALVVGANLPDIDVACYFLGSDFALGLRRGWTHGWPALIVLPLLLWGSLLLWHRRRPPPASVTALSPKWLLALCYLGVLTHPSLDWLNTYGMRWLMPLGESWFYGDSIFIIDPWLWLILLASWLTGRKSARTRRVTVGIGLAALYLVSMIVLHEATERRVRGVLEKGSASPVEDLLVGPEPANPLAWDVVAHSGERYRIGRYSWLRRELRLSEVALADARADPLWPRIQASGQAPGFLGWVRFPWLESERDATGLRVYVMDARYVRRRTIGFGGALIHLPQ